MRAGSSAAQRLPHPAARLPHAGSAAAPHAVTRLRRAALRKSGAAPERTHLLGDTPYDIAAARACGVATIALRCGGWWNDDALACAVAIHDDPAALLAAWSDSPLARSAFAQAA